jgi:hypothetical protein
MTRQTLRRWGLNLILAGFSLLLFIAVTEIAFSVFAPQITIKPPLMYAPHPVLRYIPNPGTEWPYRTTEFETRVSINTHGMRDYERPLEKTPGTFRILCLGDSFTLGAEVAVEETYPKVLERLLNERSESDSIRFEVLNGGVAGYGTFQELLFLSEFGLKHNPDLILLQFYSNDVRDNIAFYRFWQSLYPDSTLFFSEEIPPDRASVAVAGSGTPSAAEAGGLKNALDGVKALLNTHSHLYSFLRSRINILISLRGWQPLTAFDDLVVMSRDYPPDIERGWAVTQALTLKMRDMAASRQAAFAILITPNKAQVDQSGRYDRWITENRLDPGKPARILKEFGGTHQIPALDPTADLQEAGRNQTLYYTWDGHWNKYGCEAVARSLNRFLKQEKLIQ